MSAERWTRVRQIFEAALELPNDARAAFLDARCGGDADLRREVESLLASHDQGDALVDRPVFEAAADLIAGDEAASWEGRQIGPYLVRREIGRGGMGIVYLAEDVRLGRTVALKALAPEFTRDRERRERLRLEARAAALLSHPGIATVYALEEQGDDLFIVSEYVAGRTLRSELERGALPLVRALDTAIAVGRALAVAHDHGIVHRDLKPENVMRSDHGPVKVLDFGLARFAGTEAETGRLTAAGAIVGTIAYMSPEQLDGRPLDTRSDVFSFGVLLYELVSGVHPFDGTTAVSTIGRILTADPPPLARAGDPVFEEIDRIIGLAIRKNPEERYGSIHDAVRDLERLKDRLTSGVHAAVAAPTPAATSPRWWWRFHQAAVSVVYGVSVYPVWLMKEWTDATAAPAIFIGASAVAAVNATLRLHLLFTARVAPDALGRELGATARWVRWSDRLFAALLLWAGAMAGPRAALGALLVAIGVISLVTAEVIEPATTRAAFPRPPA
jgi:hypothetical protein